ncbi:hypothetical protein P170DRAFT_432259 [Aspergillus steynii IBT 23096]|uniref:Transmembrane protein n=1 Tax=Aspergillus steynii IBT 23096 TaxID=1392250 RepID=A0A2I2GP26_9EURO|nr:uncharacterized protein P170DRAFT_432259 [Aspergillus steynii IBT 23096]PLB54629.1 hypothetical protein P170DRAFT_432259 [Aspergillus steynii IBT 23096]
MSNQQNQPPQSQQQPRVILDPHNYQRPRPAPRPRTVQDIRQTKEYKVAARRWLSTIVALPILMYTSYMLFERTYGNKSPRSLGSPSSSGQEGKKDGN